MQVWWRRWEVWVWLAAVYALLIASMPFTAVGRQSQQTVAGPPEALVTAVQYLEERSRDEALEVTPPLPPTIRLPIVRYRALYDGTRRARPAVSVGRLEEHLHMLAAEGYQVLGLRDVLDALRGDVALPARAVALTFDATGDRHDGPILSLLAQQRVRAAFLVWPDRIGWPGSPTDEGMKEFLQVGMDIVGKIAFSTERTVQRAPDALGDQIMNVQGRLAQFGVEPLPLLALTVVSPTQEEVRALATAGLEAALTLQAGTALDPAQPYELPVVAVSGEVSVDQLRRALTGQPFGEGR